MTTWTPEKRFVLQSKPATIPAAGPVEWVSFEQFSRRRDADRAAHELRKFENFQTDPWRGQIYRVIDRGGVIDLPTLENSEVL